MHGGSEVDRVLVGMGFVCFVVYFFFVCFVVVCVTEVLGILLMSGLSGCGSVVYVGLDCC